MAAMATQKPYLDAVGLSYQQLTADEVRQLEPSLGHQFRHGMLQTQAQTVRQPDRLLKRLADQLQRRGVLFLQLVTGPPIGTPKLIHLNLILKLFHPFQNVYARTNF
jgi:glycine/D-amino acid oxidase-like deaminating enzyme